MAFNSSHQVVALLPISTITCSSTTLRSVSYYPLLTSHCGPYEARLRVCHTIPDPPCNPLVRFCNYNSNIVARGNQVLLLLMFDLIWR